MIDFKIRRGPYSQLFNEDGSIRRDTVALELGCWYLCTDEAWLYLCVEGDDGQLELKQINRNTNATNKPTTGVLPDGSEAERQILDIYTDETTGLLHILFSDDTEEVVVTSNVLDDKLSNIVFPEIDLSEYAKTSDLSGFITIQDVEAKNYLTEVPEGFATETYVDNKISEIVIPSTDGFATKKELNEAIESIVHPSVDLSSYATTQYVDDEISKIEFPEVDLTNYFTKEETADAIADAISEQKTIDLTSYATKEWVESKKYLTSIPETYVTKSEMNSTITAAVKEKANEIPFKTAKFVSNPIGSFTVGEDIGGLSIAELFAKLLGLKDTNSPDNPGIPEEPQGIIEKILNNEYPIYDIDEEGQLNKVKYNYNAYTSEVAADQLGSSTGFYQIKIKDVAIESGYEHYTEPQEMYYMIAIPSMLELGRNVDVFAWDNGLESWNPIDSSAFTHDYSMISSALSDAGIELPEIPNGYTLWADLGDINSGMQYRFVIKEV